MKKEILKKLDGANKQSEKAIKQFTTTEETLKQQNQVIADTLDEAQQEILVLQAIRENGLRKHEENAGIIDRIGQIVRGN